MDLKRSGPIVFTLAAFGGVGAGSLLTDRACKEPPHPSSPEAARLPTGVWSQMQNEYEQCRRRRTGSSGGSSIGGSGWGSKHVSRGGFGGFGSGGG